MKAPDLGHTPLQEQMMEIIQKSFRSLSRKLGKKEKKKRRKKQKAIAKLFALNANAKRWIS